MKKQYLLVLVLGWIASVSFGQSSQFKGGYGHFGIGPGWLKSTEFTQYLSGPEVMGPSLNWKSLGISAGGEGFAEIHGLIIGGGGFGLAMPGMVSDSASAWMGAGAGYFKTGYVFHQTGRQFAAITAGFGAGGLGISIKNNRLETPIRFDTQDPIAPGDEKEYAIGYALFDFGLSYKIVSSNTRAEERGRYGGFMFGIDAGSWLGVKMDEWRRDGEATSHIDAPGNYFSPYIRLTVGGGSFKRPVL